MVEKIYLAKEGAIEVHKKIVFHKGNMPI